MRTVRTKIYSFDELTEEAKQVAIENYRNNFLDHDFIYDEAYKTVEEFNELFNLNEGQQSWLDFSTNFENDIENLRGLRLQKYIYNNFGYKLFKSKCFSLWSKTELSYKHHKEGYPVLKSRYSRVITENSCVLTGMCYDDDMLKPIYDFLKQREFNENETFETILNECFKAIEKTIEEEKEYRESDEAIIEDIEANEYEFLKDGKQY